MTNSTTVLILATDPSSGRGGIATALSGYLSCLAEAGVEVQVIPTHHPDGWYGKWYLLVQAVPRMIREIVRLRRANRKPIVYLHAGEWPSVVRKAIPLVIAKAFGVKTVLHIHGLPTVLNFRGRVGARLFSSFVRPADVIVALTPWWKARFRAAGVRNPIVVIPNPMPAYLESVVRDLPVRQSSNRPFTVLTLARMVREKNVDLVISALAHLPNDVRLIIGGDGKDLGRCKKLARDLGVEHRVQFRGWIGSAEKEDLLKSADCFCLPSQGDSFGMGYIEAMAYGIPVVALNWGPIPDVVPEGFVGRLAQSPDAKAVAQAIEQVRTDPERNRFGENGKAWVKKRFAVSTITPKITALLHDMPPADADEGIHG